MRINPVRIAPFSAAKNNSPSYKGTTQIKYINVKTEDKVKDGFDGEDFDLFPRQKFVKGEVPLERVETTYEPDVMLKGPVYYADWGEYVGDWAKETHSAVIADRQRISPNIERVRDYEEDHIGEVMAMQKWLGKDIVHQEKKIQEETEELPRLKLREAENPPAETEEEGELPPSERLAQDIERRKARLEELKEMKTVADGNYEAIMEDLRLSNYDYFTERKKRPTNAKGPYD